VKRPPFEVADIIRRSGRRFVDRYRDSLTWPQVKVLRAIERCRTAALGGHRDQCDRCGHRAISYNSCIMGSNPLWRVAQQKGMLHAASRPFDSPLRLALEKCEQFVGSPKLAFAKAW